MMPAKQILESLNGSGLAGGLAGGAASGALVSALMSKKGRKYAGKALAVGGVAALGGLAWKAYQSYQQSEAPAQSTSPFDFNVQPDTQPGSRGLLLVRAMIAAAVADGHMDEAERTRIMTRMNELGLQESERNALAYEFISPLSMDEVVREVTDQALAIEVYLASLLAIDEHLPQGRVYLDQLAARLKLPRSLISVLDGASVPSAQSTT